MDFGPSRDCPASSTSRKCGRDLVSGGILHQTPIAGGIRQKFGSCPIHTALRARGRPTFSSPCPSWVRVSGWRGADRADQRKPYANKQAFAELKSYFISAPKLWHHIAFEPPKPPSHSFCDRSLENERVGSRRHETATFESFCLNLFEIALMSLVCYCGTCYR